MIFEEEDVTNNNKSITASAVSTHEFLLNEIENLRKENNKLKEGIYNLLLLIEEHGDKVMLAHASTLTPLYNMVAGWNHVLKDDWKD